MKDHIRRQILEILVNDSKQISGSKLFLDYVNNYNAVKDFYPPHFSHEPSWLEIIESTKEKDCKKLAEILRRQNQNMGSGQAVMDNIDRLIEGKTFAVITGQQAGILTGPLYTIYKAMTAVKLAQSLENKHDADFIPVFWIETNDNDMEEVNHLNLLDSDSNLIKMEYTPEDYKPGCSMKDVILDNDFKDFIDNLKDEFPDTDFRNKVFGLIEESYKPSRNLGDAFGRMMAGLLGDYGLVLFDPSDKEAKELMSPVFRREIENPLKCTEIINSAGEKLNGMGYESQVEKSDDSTCLFIENEGIREKLLYRNSVFVMENKDESLTMLELLEILDSQPWRFSPNVALRPVTQDFIFPTAAYVAGPGEISYFAQLRGIYDFNGVVMPVIYPRSSFTLVETKVERVLNKNDLSLKDLETPYEKLFSELSKDMASDELKEKLSASRNKIEDILGELSSELADFDPNMKNIVNSVTKKIDHQINVMEQKLYQIQRSRNDILRNQIKRACMNIYPDGKPQGRVFNIVQYLVLYGLGLIDDIMENI
ncbi:bacillithiol biosynthesis cysteine-adding enzyme BshC [Candidatus Poribacteria bacterium]|nr:bacillithiol biosynthesis cysteine-adding enzyme BshC [Candidatus Poribacteria bacterium]